jgi:hypothetical protein
VKGEIQNMNMGKSTGLDNISTKLMKQAGDTITESLLEVFNLSVLGQKYFQMIGNLPK